MRQGKGLSVPDCLVWRMEQDQDATDPSDARVLPVVLYPETLERVNELHLGDNHGNEPEGPLTTFPVPPSSQPERTPSPRWHGAVSQQPMM